MRHYARLIFVFLVEMGFLYVGQAGLELLASSDPPTSASQSDGITAETEPHEGKRKVESLWPIFRIHHQKTRYIFDLFYKRKAISRELYEYCIKEGYADKNLIAKWKKQGYENLCCLRCIQTRDTNFGTNCICRVPKSKLEVGRIIECTHCGCRGCSG
ncbi:protein BUD31 homolog isoform X1 [Gorilla gorilla gorilla]|uniref:protein BUD31 homolog isoform X1 n=1 Tax=Gorilla gorilla gorilla TaxID=9595 RepID=UPI0024465352|nr:protein BUD31 homolog isoform X1 [Gorilla gorilla gorilla]